MLLGTVSQRRRSAERGLVGGGRINWNGGGRGSGANSDVGSGESMRARAGTIADGQRSWRSHGVGRRPLYESSWLGAVCSVSSDDFRGGGDIVAACKVGAHVIGSSGSSREEKGQHSLTCF